MEGKRRPSSDLRLSEAMERYMDIKQNVLSPSTIRVYNILRRNAYGSISSMRIDRITQEDVQACVNRYAQDHSAKSCRNALGFLTAVLSMFMPGISFRIKLPQAVPPQYYTPSDEDIQKLIGAIRNEELRRAVLLAAFGTLRRSEVCGLSLEDIEGDVIRVRRAMVESDSGWILKEFPKNDSSNRRIIYPQFVIDSLGDRPGMLVQMTPKRLDVAFRRAVKRAGLPPFRFHDLRAYSVSIAHAIGIPDVYLMERGGWKSDTTFKKVYRRAISDENREISAKLNEHFQKLHS